MTDNAPTTDARPDWFARILVNPASEYTLPSEVLTDERLSRDDKRHVLEEWEQDAASLSEAGSEGMAGGEPNMLREVRRARLVLDAATPGEA
jgi:hypothetical protein